MVLEQVWEWYYCSYCCICFLFVLSFLVWNFLWLLEEMLTLLLCFFFIVRMEIFLFYSYGHILQIWQCVLTPWSVCKYVLVPKANPSNWRNLLLFWYQVWVFYLSGVVLEGSVNSCWKNPHRLLCFEEYCSHGSHCKDSIDFKQGGEEPFCTCSTAFSMHNSNSISSSNTRSSWSSTWHHEF